MYFDVPYYDVDWGLARVVCLGTLHGWSPLHLMDILG